MQPYQDPVILKYIELIKSKAPALFKGFYIGDPIRVPASKLPALIVAKRTTSADPITNAEDEHDMTLVFTVVTDIRKDISDETSIVAGVSSLYDIIEGRDPATLALKPASLLQILRHNVDINQDLALYTDAATPTKVDYGMTLGKRAEDTWALEGSVTIVAKLIQLR